MCDLVNEQVGPGERRADRVAVRAVAAHQGLDFLEASRSILVQESLECYVF